MESLSSYARQFLGQMEKPDVEVLKGFSPAISVSIHEPQSTLHSRTVTEIMIIFRLCNRIRFHIVEMWP